MSGLLDRFPKNRRCIERCGKVAICSRLIAMGQEDLKRAETAEDYSSSGAEYETDGGRPIPLEEALFGPSKQRLEEAGNALVSSGTNMRRMLMEACPAGGPFELTRRIPDPNEEGSFIWVEGATICRSEHAGMVSFTEEDLDH